MTDIPTNPPALPVLSFRRSALSSRKATRFRLKPNEQERAAIAADLEIISVPRLLFEGEITPLGRHDFVLSGTLSAEVVQACSITLAPVPATIHEQVRRRYLADFRLPEADEIELDADDEDEPLGEAIDVVGVAREALALALPPYPRAPGAELGSIDSAPPGATPLRDTDLKPFAGLASLADKLKKAEKEPE